MTKKMSMKERTVIACEYLKEKWSADVLIDYITIKSGLSDDDSVKYIAELVALGREMFEKIDAIASEYDMPAGHARMTVVAPAVNEFASMMLKIAEEDRGESEGRLN